MVLRGVKMKTFSYHGHDPHEIDLDSINQEPDLFLADIEKVSPNGLDYLIELQQDRDAWKQEFENAMKISNGYFQAHEAFMVQLSCILGLDYTETSEEDILRRVKELKDFQLQILKESSK